MGRKRENKSRQTRQIKKLSNVVAWELSKQAYIDVRQKKFEQKLERKKATYVEKMQNKVAEIHKKADEKKGVG